MSKVTNNLCIFISRIYIFNTVTLLLYDDTDCGTLTATNLTNVKSVTLGNTTFGESKTVECETGYRLRNSNNNSVVSSVLKCEATGKWTVFAGCEKKGTSHAFIHSVFQNFILSSIYLHVSFLSLPVYPLWYQLILCSTLKTYTHHFSIHLFGWIFTIVLFFSIQ